MLVSFQNDAETLDIRLDVIVTMREYGEATLVEFLLVRTGEELAKYVYNNANLGTVQRTRFYALQLLAQLTFNFFANRLRCGLIIPLAGRILGIHKSHFCNHNFSFRAS